MNKILLALCLVSFAACSSAAMAVQVSDSSQSTDNASTATHSGWPTPEETVSRMSNKLNLTDDQKAKITPVIQERQSQIREVISDTSGRRMQKARKMKSIMANSDKKIQAVLTSEQKKTYEQMKEQMREEMRSRMQERKGNFQ